MNILIAGASGFIGKNLVEALLAQGHTVVALGRKPPGSMQFSKYSIPSYCWEDLFTIPPDEFSAIINLAGENIGNKRWSTQQKSEILHSRVSSTNKIINWINAAQRNKPQLYNASAIGIYPSGNAELFTEESNTNFATKCFLIEVAEEWEAAAKQATKSGIPVTIMRFGVVLKKGEGILKKLYPSFYLGLGSVLGNGSQAFSWIEITDLLSAIIFLINRPDLTGTFNICSPNPITHAKFCHTLAKTIKRPLLLKMPSFLVNMLFGQMGQELLLEGQSVYPKRLIEAGFKFSYDDIEQALAHQWLYPT